MFRAHEPGRDRLVAIKVFRLDLTPEQTSALVRELEGLVGKGLSHPSIAAPIAAGLEAGAAYLAEEYAVGDSLDVVLRERGPLPFDAALNLIDTLAEAIDYAADRGVAHGSLHPRDLILSPDGVRLTGLGIASALSQIGARLPTRPPYALSGSLADDVYSLAAIAFEAISGRRLSAANLKEFGAEHGPELFDVFAEATAGAPQLRPVRARDFAARLNATARPGLEPRPPAKVDIDFDVVQEERFTDLPPPIVDPFPASWNAQPPRPLQAEIARREGLRVGTILLVSVFILAAALIGYAAIYFIKSPPPAQNTAVEKTPTPVTETVVDLPPANPPAPSVVTPPVESAPTPPPATPSRLASGAGARTEPSPVTGSLVIRSTPANADVLVNGQARGKTPVTVRDLPLGSYTIRVAREGYETAQRAVRLTAGRSTAAMTLTLRSTPAKNSTAASSPGASVGGITVQSRPAGARVYVNNKLIGSTPLVIPGLPAGPATVRIEMDGYRTWATTVSVVAGEQTRVGASLDRR